MESDSKTESSWNINVENQINDWKNKCFVYYDIHNDHKKYYIKFNNWSIGTSIIFSGVTVLLGGLSINYPNIFIDIAVVFCGVVVTSINTYKTSAGIIDKLSKHHEIASKYMQLIFMIEQEMALSSHHRTDAVELIKLISQEMIHIQDFSSDLPMSIDRNLHKAATMREIYKKQPEYERDKSIKMIPGLTEEENDKFCIYFEDLPNVDKQMYLYQMKRLNRV
jgi:hypothetical protein